MRTGLLVVALVVGLLSFSPAHAAEPEPTEPTASAPTVAPPQPIVMRERPRIKGVVRYGKTLRRTTGRYSVAGVRYRTQWLRDGRPIKGATTKRYRIRVRDVGHHLRVRVTVRKRGHRPIERRSKYRTVKHVRDARHTVRYTVVTNGSITADVARFRRQVDQTLNDPRGWRSAGVAFKRVRSGGPMTVVLAQATKVPTYSSGCSAQWSCRVGRYVIINQDRWKHATPAWNASRHTTLRGYRHMVVNHEAGHWLGWGHASCSGRGQKAPVMMQQSKGRSGCQFNAWPKASERNVPRYR